MNLGSTQPHYWLTSPPDERRAGLELSSANFI